MCFKISPKGKHFRESQVTWGALVTDSLRASAFPCSDTVPCQLAWVDQGCQPLPTARKLLRCTAHFDNFSPVLFPVSCTRLSGEGGAFLVVFCDNCCVGDTSDNDFIGNLLTNRIWSNQMPICGTTLGKLSLTHLGLWGQYPNWGLDFIIEWNTSQFFIVCFFS